MKNFKPYAKPLLIGSLPMDNHADAVQLVFDHTPDIPLWVQLPCYREEGMIDQFMEGLPGFVPGSGKNQLDTTAEDFDTQVVSFFEDYLAASDAGSDLSDSRFALAGKRKQGFAEFLRRVDEQEKKFTALKGQVTGPVTFCTAVKDMGNKDIFYDDQLRDAAIKKLALNARWQAREFSKRDALPIVFLDEPALAGFGTSAYITITKEDVLTAVDEIVMEIHAENGLAGVHVCGNTQWDLLLESSIDIISFDTFSYFDRFILYPEQIKSFLNQGKILAWGIVPTDQAEVIHAQTTQSLVEKFQGQIDELSRATGLDKDAVLSQSFVTPSCGTGSLDLESARKVLELTASVSKHFASAG